MFSKSTFTSLFIESAKAFSVSKNQMITFNGPFDKPKDIFFLSQGIVSLTSSTPDGKELVYDYFTQPTFINLIPVLVEIFHYVPPKLDVRLIAKTDCQLYSLSIEQFMKIFDDSKIKDDVIEYLLTNYIISMNKHRSLGEESTLEQVCQFILRYAQEKEDHQLYLDPVFTYIEIANYLQVHEVTVTRHFKTLKEEKLIERSGKKLYIRDKKALMTFANNL